MIVQSDSDMMHDFVCVSMYSKFAISNMYCIEIRRKVIFKIPTKIS